jgi:hypothetical protein
MKRGGNRGYRQVIYIPVCRRLTMESMKRGGNRGYRKVSYILVCRGLTMELHEERRKQRI